MYQTQQTEALSPSVYLYSIFAGVYQVICGKSNEGKDTCRKGVIDAL